jgi:hypothetical protein
MVEVADLTNRSFAVKQNESYFPGRKAYVRIAAFLREELRCSSGGSCDLASLAWSHLDVVDHGPQRDKAQWQGVSRENVSRRTGQDLSPDFELVRSQDIPFLSVLVVEQCDPCRSVRIVLDRGNLPRDFFFVPLEIDETVSSLVASPSIPGGDAAIVVPAA